MFNFRRLQRIELLLNRLDAAVVARDPGTARSAEVFDGLRKSIVNSRQARRAHVGHLLALHDSIEREASYEVIKDRVSDYLQDLGVHWLTDCAPLEFFEIIEIEGSGDNEDFICVEPAAYEILEDGRPVVIRMGKARCVRTKEVVEVLSESDSKEGGGSLIAFFARLVKRKKKSNASDDEQILDRESTPETLDTEEGSNTDSLNEGEES